MKRLVLLLVMVASVFRAEAYHWTPNSAPYANTLTAIGIIELDGVEQGRTDIEIGVFCGDECRGREVPIYIGQMGSYRVFLTVYGNDGDTLGFRLYDHGLGEELVADGLNTMVFSANAVYGTVAAPYVFGFETVTYEIGVAAHPAEGGMVSGAGEYLHGTTCTLTATAAEHYAFVNWTKDGEVVSTVNPYAFTVTEAASYVANFELSTITQTTGFTAGWTWWSAYVEADDLLGQLQAGLGSNGILVKSQTSSSMYMAGSWFGSFALTNDRMYMVNVSAPTTASVTGQPVSAANHPITLDPGWNWVGFPSTETMTVAEALADHTPLNGDLVKSQTSSSIYMMGGWMSGFSLTPGIGLMYSSHANNQVSFTLANPTRETETEGMTDLHWQANYHAYPNNMTVLAVVELDGEELVGENYELAAFADGECRGSARLMFAEPLGRYLAILTIAGDEATNLAFGLYDAATGMEETQDFASLQYETDAIVGGAYTPFIVRFRSATGVGEWAGSVNVFPNPVGRGERFSLGMTGIETGKVRIDIVNALGAVVETLQTTSPQALAAPQVSGVYTLRITVEGKGVCYRKLIVE